jgi:hypothetical protein
VKVVLSSSSAMLKPLYVLTSEDPVLEMWGTSKYLSTFHKSFTTSSSFCVVVRLLSRTTSAKIAHADPVGYETNRA